RKTDLARTLVRLAAHRWGFDRQVARFHETVTRVLAVEPAPEHGLDRLAADYRALERELLGSWQIPLLNDLYTMIFTSLLRRLVARWCPAEPDALVSDLLRGEPGLASVEPALWAARIARLVRDDEALAAALA